MEKELGELREKVSVLINNVDHLKKDFDEEKGDTKGLLKELAEEIHTFMTLITEHTTAITVLQNDDELTKDDHKALESYGNRIALLESQNEMKKGNTANIILFIGMGIALLTGLVPLIQQAFSK